MHKIDFDLTIDEITKVEGSAGLDVKVRNGRVENVHFKIEDYKRFYTQAIQGKVVAAAPQLLSRICGTCSVAHLMTAIEAVENALSFTPTEQTKILRKLTYHGLIIRDHALHLYIFCLPDLFHKDSILDFDDNNPKEHRLLHDAFDVKAAGNHLAILVAGRSIHAPYPVAGGFLQTPKKDAVAPVLEKLKAARPKVLHLIDVFLKSKDSLIRKTDYVALKANPYSYLDGKLCDQNGIVANEKDFRKHLEHVVLPYSQASAYTFEGKPFRVGALARININKDALHPKTKKDAKHALKKFPSDDIFDNNLAQAIEILHSIDESLGLLTETNFTEEKPAKLVMKKGIGIGVIEAPRGTLYHKLEIDEKGVVKKGEIIVPTGQNQLAIELDIKEYIQQNLNMPKEKLSMECEKIIRAYDPCMSCASHFLKMRWI